MTMPLKKEQISLAQRNKLIDYILVSFIMALTGFEYFYRGKTLIIVLFLLSGFYFLKRGLKFDKRLILIIIPFLIVSIIQTFLGYNQNILTSILLLLSFLTYFFIAAIIHRKFIDVFIKTILVICLISLVFFFLTYFGSFMDLINKVSPTFTPLGFKEDLQGSLNESRNIIIYNFKDYYSIYNRNSGPFWEPGMFVIFINLALYFNLIISKRLFSLKNIVFAIAILTTFSTTGYIAFIFTLFIYSLFYSKSKLGLIYLIGIVTVSLYVSDLDFMRPKIEAQFADKKNGMSRFGAMVIHYQVISQYPITGVGDGASKVISGITDVDSTANGITFVFVKYGIFLGLLYYILLYNACVNVIRQYSKHRITALSLFILLMILAFSQDITVRHFYLFFIVWGLFEMAPKRRVLKRYNPAAAIVINNV